MSNFVSFFAWSFLPDFVTNNAQSLWYSLTIRAGSPRPQPGTPPHTRLRRRIYISVVALYLLYTLFEADWEIRRASDFYRDLGVPHDVSDKALQSRFRRLTLLHHPDKQGVTDAAARAAADAHYVHLQLARDTLLDPARRFAYDRFGPDVTAWKHCSTVRDFVAVGVQRSLGFYIGTGAFMVIFGLLGLFDWGEYWRYLAFTFLLTFELHTVTRPTFPYLTTHLLNPLLRLLSTLASNPLLTVLVAANTGTSSSSSPSSSVAAPPPPQAYLPFQTIQLSHKAIITFFIALSRLGPLLATSALSPARSSDHTQHQLTRLDALARAAVTESTRLLGLEMVPFQEAGGGGGGGELLGKVRARLRDWFVHNSVRGAPEVRDAVGRVVERRRAGAGRARP